MRMSLGIKITVSTQVLLMIYGNASTSIMTRNLPILNIGGHTNSFIMKHVEMRTILVKEKNILNLAQVNATSKAG